ncbi:hypothetical protein QJS10_CPB04g01581 [Acorus calamus]|uniref:Uncharacterized protein n=1 Tax=Acorus calamus TaxID=4465 RepID=A0AAV9EW95_ACOCL|nr:hypothetical protein QJS10_CPB04g01581 [Acorus calamus]
MWSDCRNKGLRRSSVIWGNAVKKLEMDAVVAFCGMNGLMKMVERVPYIGNVDYWNVSLVHPQPNGSEAQSEDQLSMLKKVVIQHQPLLQDSEHPQQQPQPSGTGLMLSATELKEAGILDIVMEIPPLCIYDDTFPILRNLIMFKKFYPNTRDQIGELYTHPIQLEIHLPVRPVERERGNQMARETYLLTEDE